MIKKNAFLVLRASKNSSDDIKCQYAIIPAQGLADYLSEKMSQVNDIQNRNINVVLMMFQEHGLTFIGSEELFGRLKKEKMDRIWDKEWILAEISRWSTPNGHGFDISLPFISEKEVEEIRKAVGE